MIEPESNYSNVYRDEINHLRYIIHAQESELQRYYMLAKCNSLRCDIFKLHPNFSVYLEKNHILYKPITKTKK